MLLFDLHIGEDDHSHPRGLEPYRRGAYVGGRHNINSGELNSKKIESSPSVVVTKKLS
ncbi:unnamed protein product [Dovyalis caffra]|uniref:Uncharacterized protein n=1 Tax=Dovyalis caffra TaxID=77055 RepID=A0AAV1QT97_9ROSI|nr:unnamed protein product [Dovyalis caffra]